jgi:hypothetical protein
MASEILKTDIFTLKTSLKTNGWNKDTDVIDVTADGNSIALKSVPNE